MISDAIQAHGLFDFTAAKGALGTFFENAGSRIDVDDDAAELVRDLMLLNAAEIELAGMAAHHEEVDLPLEVSSQAASRATFLTDSGPFVGHDPRAQPRLWDVTLYGSDASKLAWLAGSDAVDEVAASFIPIMSELAGYCERYANIYGNRQIFALRATVWRARIAALRGETDHSDILAVYEALAKPEFA